MTIAFQLVLFALVALSLILIVGVPVAYALPQSWDRSRPLLWLGSGVWFALVIAVAVLNFFVA